ncbi:MAG: permease [Pirellulaceae bacterium]
MNAPLAMLIGGLIRIGQGFIAAAPTLLVGLLIAAILRYYLGRDGTKKLFGDDSLRSLPQSWLIGMLLPVCSIGVLPILIQMRRSGVKPGAMSAFALSAPLFNPLSLLYGLTLSRPLVIVLFAVGSLLIVTALGLLWDALGKRTQPSTEGSVADGDPDLIGPHRLAALLVQMARDASGKPLALTFLALSGLAVLAAALPYGAMQTSVERDDPLAPLTMLLVSVPVYATPMLAMSQLGMMFQHANSPGAAFTLLILGTGMNFATPFWFGKNFGWKSSALWFAGLLLIVVGISYGINKPLIPPGVEPAGHTHAFDIYANPLPSVPQDVWTTCKEAISKQAGIADLIALAVRPVSRLLVSCCEDLASTKNDSPLKHLKIPTPWRGGDSTSLSRVASSVQRCWLAWSRLALLPVMRIIRPPPNAWRKFHWREASVSPRPTAATRTTHCSGCRSGKNGVGVWKWELSCDADNCDGTKACRAT